MSEGDLNGTARSPNIRVFYLLIWVCTQVTHLINAPALFFYCLHIHKYYTHWLKEVSFSCLVCLTPGGGGTTDSCHALMSWTMITKLSYCSYPSTGCYLLQESHRLSPQHCMDRGLLCRLIKKPVPDIIPQRYFHLAFLCHASCEHTVNDKCKHLLFLIFSPFWWDSWDGLLAS